MNPQPSQPPRPTSRPVPVRFITRPVVRTRVPVVTWTAESWTLPLCTAGGCLERRWTPLRPQRPGLVP